MQGLGIGRQRGLVAVNTCFYCKKQLGINEPYYLMRSKDVRFRGRKRYQTVAFCCEDCEEAGKQCQFTPDEWETLRNKV